jgi:glycine cleavage system transcriptional repressor
VRAADLEAALEPAARAMGLVVAVRELAEAATPPGEPGRAATISVHGADRPGIVHAVAQAIAELGANVVDLSTHVVGAEASPGYVMVLRVALPEGLDPERLEAAVRRAAEGVGVHASMRLDDPDVL